MGILFKGLTNSLDPFKPYFLVKMGLEKTAVESQTELGLHDN